MADRPLARWSVPDLVDESPAAQAARALERAQEALADAHRSLDDAEQFMRTSIRWCSVTLVAVVADVVLHATGVVG